MAVRYYCDGCGSEIHAASKINPQPIATVEIMDAANGKQESKMLCGKCVPKLKEFITTLNSNK
jgi:hypothetical protein